MNTTDDTGTFGIENLDAVIYDANTLLTTLFPICRSITGDGVRNTLKILQETTPFTVHEIASGTKCYDWTIPKEWNIRDAYIKDKNGNRIIDFQSNNLHVVNYSTPIDSVTTFKELDPHLHTLPNLPDAIPYRTTYYKETWGFCLSDNDYKKLDTNGTYHVCIDSTLTDGTLTYGDTIVQGTSGKEFLFSTYCCHPSLANDSLSGVVLWILLLRELQSRKNLKHSYRFVIAPETIGVIAYLSKNEEIMKRIDGGFVLTTVAGPGELGYKASYEGDNLIDWAARKALRQSGEHYKEYPFNFGSDERQYSMPAFRIPVGSITKDKYYEYKQYHTSLDNLEFVHATCLVNTLQAYLRTIAILETSDTYASCMPYCEAMLGKRGLYPDIGGGNKQKAADTVLHSDDIDAIRWIMFYSDGKTPLAQIAEKTNLPLEQLKRLAELLCTHTLLQHV